MVIQGLFLNVILSFQPANVFVIWKSSVHQKPKYS